MTTILADRILLDLIEQLDGVRSAARSSIAKTQGQSARNGSAPRAASRSHLKDPPTTTTAARPATSSLPTITTPPRGKIMPRNSKQEQERKRTDNARLLRAWKAFHRDEKAAVISGSHGAVLAELFRMLKNLDSVKPAQLIGYVQSMIDWTAIDGATKLVVIHELNNSIMRFREKRGLESISDPLPSEPESPFRQLKTILFPPPGEGAHRGEARPE